ncbi:tyrosine-type recombinase/integrase [Schinkia azotoformans]|uniref:tyrosine-type recombinase/integrase n=1 Tax=Schinkia azotoformans TaxID=1454 RepID=UPI002DB9EC90|nr:site-specific integrase [Schinkia azotoformans]MEC1714699.1 site-specific integrase [Schinkia azotoformans]MEC1757545.1 site-specific integrase [Schinkia azotoformans]
MSSFKQVRPGTYEFRIELGYDSLGKRIRKFKTLPCKNDTEAKKILARLEVDIMDGKFVDNNNISFEALYEKWKEEYAPHNLDPKTQETYEYVIDAAILPEFKKAKMKSIMARDIIRYFNREEKAGVGPYALEKRHRCIRSLFYYAKKFEYIKEDVSLEVPKPKVKARKKEYYDEDEIAKLFEVIENASTHQKLMIILAVTGALRRGEVLGIDMYKDIDFENNTIHIRHSVQKTKSEGLRVKGTKTDEERVVTFDELTMEDIKNYRDEREKEIEKISDEYKGFKAENGEKVDLLFAHIDGTPYDPGSVSQFWSRIVERYKLKKIAFHDLRHSSATFLLSQGFSMKAIQERLGHKDISTTMNLYTHVTKKLDAEVGNAFLKVRKGAKKRRKIKSVSRLVSRYVFTIKKGLLKNREKP